MLSASDEPDQFVPKSNLERTFIQARYLNSLHQWRKGTTELHSEKLGQATGFYLAMARTQCLDGYHTQAEATLDCIWDYHKKFSDADKLSVIRIVCNILEEQNLEGTKYIITKESVRSRFLKMSVALAGQLHQDKIAQMEALALIKKSTKEDLIGASVLKKQISSLEEFIDECKPRLFEQNEHLQNEHAQNEDSQNEDIQNADPQFSYNVVSAGNAGDAVLTSIFDRVALLPADINVFLLLTKLATNLIAANQLNEAITVCAYIRSYCPELPKRQQSLKCGESISQVFEKELKDPDGANSFTLDTTLKELKLQNYLTARKNVAISTFEEHYLSWSQGLGANKFGYLAPESIGQQSADISLDLVIANILNYLADQLNHKTKTEEACACNQQAVLARIQAQKIDQRDIEDLSYLAATTLISKRYDRALALLSDIRCTLQFSTYQEVYCERLSTYANLLEQLFGELAQVDCKLSVKSCSTINYAMILFSLIGTASQFDELLPQVIEILTSRVDRSVLPDVLRICWKQLTRLPIRTIVEVYVQSLTTMTELSLDKTLANSCYLEFLGNLVNQEWETRFAIPLLTKVIADRENDADKDSLTELPLVAALAMLYLENGDSDKCQISSDALQTFCSDVVGSQTTDMLRLQCVKAFLQFEKVTLTLAKQDPHSFAFVQSTMIGSLIKEIIQACTGTLGAHKDLCLILCDFLASFIQENLATPKSLLDAVHNFDSETLVETIKKLEKKFVQGVLVKLADELIRAKYPDVEGASDTSIIPLLLIKVKYLQKSAKFKEVDKVYLQIIALEKLVSDDSVSVPEGETDSLLNKLAVERRTYRKDDRVFHSQANFLHSLTEREEFDQAFELAFEMITKSTEILDSEQVSCLFEEINNFVLRYKYTHAIELMVAILTRLQTLNFDKKMMATFDLIFISCLQRNESEKAQLMLNRAKILTKAHYKGESELNFIDAAANRYVNAFADREEFRFAKLKAALEDLRSKKVFCNDLESFVRMVLKVIEKSFTCPDDETQQSPPD